MSKIQIHALKKIVSNWGETISTHAPWQTIQYKGVNREHDGISSHLPASRMPKVYLKYLVNVNLSKS